MNGGDSGVGTYRAYQADAVRVNQNCQKLHFKKKDLWTIRQMLWKTLWTVPLTPTLSPKGRGSLLPLPFGERVGVRGLPQPGASTWMTRLAIISRVLAP
jgi:hypothetical protein